ncbi:MAG TPA: RNA polymerase sigma factor SigJ [Solirubrobacteraceae bacterium]|nr:RNA polymerase sigma factor SigJ [Solirubrobacteraceae bacterium]
MTDDGLEELRRHGFAVAYRMLGSVVDAEELVQEGLLRLTKADPPPDEPAAWLTTVVTRLAIDHLRLARTQRETYVGPWLPEPLLTDPAPGPAARAELADTLSQAFLVVLEQLTPLERAAFLLREAFDYPYGQIAAMLNRSEASCRQVVTRARAHVAAGRPRFEPDLAARDALLERFLAAVEEGDVAGLEALLAEDAVLVSDGGGRISAARKPIHGAARIARVLTKIASKRRVWEPFAQARVTVNGQPGYVLRSGGGQITDVVALDVVDGRVAAVRVVRNPDKLAHLHAADVTGGAGDPSGLA